MTNLGNMKYFLGIEFHESKAGIFISQSKYAHDIFKRFYKAVVILSHPFKASTVATAFMETVQKLHGSPNIIVSDRDPIFTRNFWT